MHYLLKENELSRLQIRRRARDCDLGSITLKLWLIVLVW